jgi:hypothetical protein
MVSGQFTDCLIDTIMWDRDKDDRIAYKVSSVVGPRIAAARNDLVRHFLRSDASWMWMVDADMTWNPATYEAALRVLAPNPEIKFLSGLCFIGGRHYGIHPSMYGQNPMDKDDYISIMDYPKDAICKVAAVGAAWQFVHRDVFEAVAKKYGHLAHPWFSEVERPGGRELGEDIVFCQRVSDVGHDIWVHTGLHVGHMKMQPVTEFGFDQQQAMDPDTLEASNFAFVRGMGMAP